MGIFRRNQFHVKVEHSLRYKTKTKITEFTKVPGTSKHIFTIQINPYESIRVTIEEK